MRFPCEGVCTVFLGVVFPTAGVFTSSFIGTNLPDLGLSPLPAVQKVSRTKSLDSLNILPLAVLFINAFAWLFYAFVISNYYIFFSNILNFGACLYYVMTCFPLETADRQVLITRILVFMGVCLMTLSALCFITFRTNYSVKQQISGWTAVVTLLIFYVSPLSTLKQVVKSKCSDSIHFFLAVTSLINGLLWTVYGLFLQDPFVSLPNLLGTVTGIAQIILCAVYPKSDVK